MYDERFQSLLMAFSTLKTTANEAIRVFRVVLALSKEDTGIIDFLQLKVKFTCLLKYFLFM